MLLIVLTGYLKFDYIAIQQEMIKSIKISPSNFALQVICIILNRMLSILIVGCIYVQSIGNFGQAAT